MNPPLPPNSSGRGGYPPYPKQPPLPHEDHSSATQYPPHAQQQQQHHRHHQQHNQHHPSNHHQAPYYPPPPHHHNHHQPPPYQQHRNPYPNQHQQHNHYPQHHRQPHHDPHVHPPLPGYHDAAPRHQGPPPPGYHPPQPRMASGRPAPPPPSYPMDRPQSSYNAPPPPPYHYPPRTNPGGMYQPPMPSIPPMSYVCRKCNLGGHWIHDCMKKPNQQLKQPPTKSQQSHGDWHCEPCEKHFAMKSQFDAHVLTHEACWAPGCDFSASKRVVTSHHQTAHGQYAGSGLKEIEVEGQKFHVLVGNSPEDITKWREERRKKWPSDANVKRKNDQHQDRVQAGDVTTASPSSKRQKKTPTDNSIPVKVDITHKPPHEPTDAWSGIDSIVDNPTTTTSPAKTPAVKKKSSKFCVKFIRNACEDGANCLFNHDIESIPCKQFVAKGTCKRGDECNFAHTGALSTAQDKAKQQYLKLQATQVKEHKSSLLRKLLAKDIDKEHRHILQSFRYLVEHQFFQPTPDDDVEVLE